MHYAPSNATDFVEGNAIPYQLSPGKIASSRFDEMPGYFQRELVVWRFSPHESISNRWVWGEVRDD